jgi:predicted nucleic acid-binding protein
MLVLDTNVVSETMRPAPEPKVMSWLGTVDPFDVAIITVTI